MSLHVTGQEATNCIRFLEKALAKWEREQQKQGALSANQAAKVKEQSKPKEIKRKSRVAQRVWTADEIAALAKAIETNQTTRSLAAQLGIAYGLVWNKRTQLEHALKLSRLRGATSSSEQRVDVRRTE